MVTEGAEPGRWVALRAVEPLRRDTTYQIKIGAGLASAEGPRLTTNDQWGSFFTYAPLRIVEHHCWYQEPCPPTAWWTVSLWRASLR